MAIAVDLFQLGIVVADINAAIAHYGRLYGIANFWRLDTDYSGCYRDWHGRFANRNAFARLGPLYLEIAQPVTGEGNAKEWLRERGEGFFIWALGSMT